MPNEDQVRPRYMVSENTTKSNRRGSADQEEKPNVPLKISSKSCGTSIPDKGKVHKNRRKKQKKKGRKKSKKMKGRGEAKLGQSPSPMRQLQQARGGQLKSQEPRRIANPPDLTNESKPESNEEKSSSVDDSLELKPFQPTSKAPEKREPAAKKSRVVGNSRTLPKTQTELSSPTPPEKPSAQDSSKQSRSHDERKVSRHNDKKADPPPSTQPTSSNGKIQEKVKASNVKSNTSHKPTPIALDRGTEEPPSTRTPSPSSNPPQALDSPCLLPQPAHSYKGEIASTKGESLSNSPGDKDASPSVKIVEEVNPSPTSTKAKVMERMKKATAALPVMKPSKSLKSSRQQTQTADRKPEKTLSSSVPATQSKNVEPPEQKAPPKAKPEPRYIYPTWKGTKEHFAKKAARRKMVAELELGFDPEGVTETPPGSPSSSTLSDETEMQSSDGGSRMRPRAQPDSNTMHTAGQDYEYGESSYDSEYDSELSGAESDMTRESRWTFSSMPTTSHIDNPNRHSEVYPIPIKFLSNPNTNRSMGLVSSRSQTPSPEEFYNPNSNAAPESPRNLVNPNSVITGLLYSKAEGTRGSFNTGGLKTKGLFKPTRGRFPVRDIVKKYSTRFPSKEEEAQNSLKSRMYWKSSKPPLPNKHAALSHLTTPIARPRRLSPIVLPKSKLSHLIGEEPRFPGPHDANLAASTLCQLTNKLSKLTEGLMDPRRSPKVLEPEPEPIPKPKPKPKPEVSAIVRENIKVAVERTYSEAKGKVRRFQYDPKKPPKSGYSYPSKPVAPRDMKTARDDVRWVFPSGQQKRKPVSWEDPFLASKMVPRRLRAGYTKPGSQPGTPESSDSDGGGPELQQHESQPARARDALSRPQPYNADQQKAPSSTRPNNSPPAHPATSPDDGESPWSQEDLKIREMFIQKMKEEAEEVKRQSDWGDKQRIINEQKNSEIDPKYQIMTSFGMSSQSLRMMTPYEILCNLKEGRPPDDLWKAFPQTKKKVEGAGYVPHNLETENLWENYRILTKELQLSPYGEKNTIFMSRKSGLTLGRGYVGLSRSDHGPYIVLHPQNVTWENFENLKPKFHSEMPYSAKYRSRDQEIEILYQLRTVEDRPNPPMTGHFAVSNYREHGYADYIPGLIYLGIEGVDIMDVAI